jgi:1,4-dihydroxy-6-naphthoate synthase
MNITVGFSPCPNDTFIFDALVNHKIDTQGINFDPRLEDVETLNKRAIDNTLDITKISFGVLPLILHNYIVLNSGSALGTGVGPLLIAKNTILKNEIDNCIIAIPGEHTTAHMLFNLAFPLAQNKIFLKYDEVENFVLQSATNNIAGVIIHENRFTYAQKGLNKIVDLGEFWEKETGYPIPLGGIVAKRQIDNSLLKKVNSLIRQSIEYAFSNYPLISPYVKMYAQEMDEEVLRKHIELYVNDYSISLQKEGKSAVIEFLKVYQGINKLKNISEKEIFLD